VAAAHQLHLSPVLLAATNSSGAVAGKMISPQNIAVGVTTVGLIAYAQAYWFTWMLP
jgi:lactate permease